MAIAQINDTEAEMGKLKYVNLFCSPTELGKKGRAWEREMASRKVDRRKRKYIIKGKPGLSIHRLMLKFDDRCFCPPLNRRSRQNT